MAIAKKPEPEAFDPWKTPKETWQFVAMPDEDPTGQKFPSIWLNKQEFQAGQTYNLPAAVAAHVKERIKVFNKSVTRLFNPTRDYAAERAVSIGTAAPSQLNYVDTSNVQTIA